MALKPEDVHKWEINDELVQAPLAVLKDLENGKVLLGVYERLKAMLAAYPPNPRYFSHPRQDLQMASFWVKSENSQVRFRAKYYSSHEICIIDKLLMPGEKIEGLDE